MDGFEFPVSINDAQYGNCIVCSPYAMLVRLPPDLWRHDRRYIEWALATAGCAALAPPLLAMGINRVLRINNWFGLTRSYGGWRGESATEMTRELTNRLPRHAILISHILAESDPGLAKGLQRAGYWISPQRLVFVLDGKAPDVPRHRNNVRDFALLEKPDLAVVTHEEFSVRDFDACARLYYRLYIEKHTPLSPRYGPRFFKLCHDLGLLTFQGLRDRTGALLGMVGTAEDNGAVRCSVVGYHTGLPRELGLYRRLIALVIREACQKKVTLILGGGAAEFKCSRGAKPQLESTAVYARHLPVSGRFLWYALRFAGHPPQTARTSPG